VIDNFIFKNTYGEEFFALIAGTNPSKYLGEIES
jgi:hypothetical protein